MKTIPRLERNLCAIAGLILAVAATPARSQYIALAPPSMPAGDSAVPIQISANGLVLLTYYNSGTGFWDGAATFNIKTNTYTNLPADPDTASYPNYQNPTGLNDKGQVVGDESSTTYTLSGPPALYWMPIESYVYSSPSTFKNYVPPFAGAFVSEAYGINNNGDVVGIFNVGTGDQGYLLSGGTFTKIDVLPTGPTPVPIDPYNGDYPTGATTDPYDINNEGQIVGSYYDPMHSVLGQQGFEYDSGVYTTIDAPGDVNTFLYGLNDQGEIVGSATDPSGTTDGFIDDHGTFTIFDYPNASATYLEGVSDDGQYVGEYVLANGSFGGFVYVPDASSTVALLALGLLGIALIRHTGRQRAIR